MVKRQCENCMRYMSYALGNYCKGVRKKLVIYPDIPWCHHDACKYFHTFKSIPGRLYSKWLDICIWYWKVTGQVKYDE